MGGGGSGCNNDIDDEFSKKVMDPLPNRCVRMVHNLVHKLQSIEIESASCDGWLAS